MNGAMRDTWRILFIPNYVLACMHENTDDFFEKVKVAGISAAKT